MKTAQWLLATIVVAGLQTGALAQFTPQQPQQSGDVPEQRRQVMEGRILDTFSVQSEMAGQEIIARVLTRGDNVAFVNLGPSGALQGINVRPGAYILVRGEWDYRGSMPVVQARQIAPVYSIDRAAEQQPPLQPQQAGFGPQAAADAAPAGQPMRQPDAGDAQAAGEQAVIGKISSIRFTQFQGVDRPHMLAKVRAIDGRTVVVDLGDPNTWRQDMDAQPGQWLAVIGHSGSINNRPVLIADQFAKLADENRTGANSEAAAD